MRRALVAILLASAGWALPHPTEKGSKTSPAIATAAGNQVQGGLVDVRYGQVSIDLGGVSVVLDLTPTSKVLLDGLAIKPDDLQKRVPDGLAAVATYQGRTGAVQSLEAFSDGKGLPAVSLTVSPSKAAYRKGETVEIWLSAAEAKRLGTRPLQLNVPGIFSASGTSFQGVPGGGFKASLKLLADTNLIQVPLMVKAGSKVYKGPRISIATEAPEITGFGPHHASARLSSIPGWVDLRSHPSLLNLASAKLSASKGVRVVSFQPRVDRCVFELKAEGPGEYWLEFQVADKSGRVARQRWPVTVLP